MTITLIIVIITAIISITAFSNEKVKEDLIFHPPSVSQRNQWYRFFTCGFIHADWAHLFFNMFSLYVFGTYVVEPQFMQIFGSNGKLFYVLLYLISLPVSILPTYQKNKDNHYYYSLGASGAVSAVVFAGLMIEPSLQVGLFIIPPIIPGFVFGPLYLIISAYLDRKGGGNINHSAHIWGALFGLAFIIVVGKFVADFNAISNFVEDVKRYFDRNF